MMKELKFIIQSDDLRNSGFERRNMEGNIAARLKNSCSWIPCKEENICKWDTMNKFIFLYLRKDKLDGPITITTWC